MQMPADRAEASYQIYSMLMPVGTFGSSGLARELWLLRDTTELVVPLDQSCKGEEGNRSRPSLNPHTAIHPDPAHAKDFAELLEDFDRHCHDSIELTDDAFAAEQLAAPLLLLNRDDEGEYARSLSGLPAYAGTGAQFKGAPGLSSFSEVYFNFSHTLAMVYGSNWCGNLCGKSLWFVLERRDGEWHLLHWRSMIMMS
jgi:hypothetical protein